MAGGYGFALLGWLLGVGLWDYMVRGWFGLELRQYFRVRRRGEEHVSLAEPRRLFATRWRSLISELAAASGGRPRETVSSAPSVT